MPVDMSQLSIQTATLNQEGKSISLIPGNLGRYSSLLSVRGFIFEKHTTTKIYYLTNRSDYY